MDEVKLVDQDITKWSEPEKVEYQQKGFRSLRADELPQVTSKVRPSDYVHDLDRGTVDYKKEWYNYSYHTVIVPTGSTIIECNFAQCVPNTEAIIGDNLTLIDCNLVNVKINPTWIVKGCLTVQSWVVDDNGTDDRLFICDHPSKLTGSEQEPLNVIKTRNF